MEPRRICWLKMLQSNYGKAGLIAECRPFKDISAIETGRTNSRRCQIQHP